MAIFKAQEDLLQATFKMSEKTCGTGHVHEHDGGIVAGKWINCAMYVNLGNSPPWQRVAGHNQGQG